MTSYIHYIDLSRTGAQMLAPARLEFWLESSLSSAFPSGTSESELRSFDSCSGKTLMSGSALAPETETEPEGFVPSLSQIFPLSSQHDDWPFWSCTLSGCDRFTCSVQAEVLCGAERSTAPNLTAGTEQEEHRKCEAVSDAKYDQTE